MRRALMITYDFPPSLEMGAQACAQIARYLPLYGWQPIVLTVHERYIESVDSGPAQPDAGLVVRTRMLPHPLSVYKRVAATRRAGAEAEGTSNGGRATSASVRRWLSSLLQVPDPYTGWMIPAIIAGLRLIRRYNVEHILSSAPYWTNHLIGFVLARSTGLPWTAHFRDPWADDPQPGRSLVARLHSALESMVVRAATTVVCVTDMHTDVLRRVYSVEHPRKFVTIPNGYDGAEWDAVMTSSVETRRATNASFVITYAGTLYMKRSPLPVFRALRALIDAGDIAREHLRIELLGDCGVANGRRVAEMAAECGIEDAVYITGRMSRRDALRRIAQSDLLLLLAEDLTLQIPGKTYEYLRAGRPILALTSRGAVADLLRRIDGAAVIDPTDARHITAFLRQAYRDWRDGREARHPEPAVVAGFDRRVLAGRFADLFAHPAARVNG